MVTEEATHEYEAQKKHAAEEKQKRMEVKEGFRVYSSVCSTIDYSRKSFKLRLGAELPLRPATKSKALSQE